MDFAVAPASHAPGVDRDVGAHSGVPMLSTRIRGGRVCLEPSDMVLDVPLRSGETERVVMGAEAYAIVVKRRGVIGRWTSALAEKVRTILWPTPIAGGGGE